MSKRRWRTFLVVEAVLLSCLVLLFMFPRPIAFFPIAACVVGAWLLFTLPIAILYLIGRPLVMKNLSLDDSESPETRAMAKDVRLRVKLGDEDFYSRFYAESVIPKDTIHRIRRVLQKRIDPDAGRLVPTDYLPLLWDGLDFADLFHILGREFGVKLGDEGAFNGILDSLIRLVDERVQNEANTIDQSAAGS